MGRHLKDNKLAIVLIAAGFLFLLHNFFFFSVWETLLKLTPLLLVWWGFQILRKSGRHSGKDPDFQVFTDTVVTTSSPFLKHSSAFGDIRIRVESEEFSGGSVSSVFGRISIDMREVKRIGSYGQLDLHSVFGDVKIYLPECVSYDVSGSNLFGTIINHEGGKIEGCNYCGLGSEGGGRKLVIRPSLVFGDMEIMK